MNRERRLGRTTTVLTSAGTTTFSYDFESRATSISGPGISQTNVYNGLDTRTGSTTNSVSQTYLRDGAYVTDPVLKDSSATYTPGVSERRGTTTTFLHSGLKNADTQTGTTQTVSATRRYDAFGNVVTSTGIWNGPFGYAGGFGYQEDATGLKLLGHRYYDSSTGRFLTRDPQKDGRNWYTYCENNPISLVDNSGLVPVILVVAVLAIAAIVAANNAGKGMAENIGRNIRRKNERAQIDPHTETWDNVHIGKEGRRPPSQQDFQEEIKGAGQEVAKGIRDVYILGVPGKIIGGSASSAAAEATDFGGTAIAELIEAIIGQGALAGDEFRKGDGNGPLLVP